MKCKGKAQPSSLAQPTDTRSRGVKLRLSVCLKIRWFLFAHSFCLLNKSFNQASKFSEPLLCVATDLGMGNITVNEMQVLLWENLIGEQTANVCLGSPSHLPSLLGCPLCPAPTRAHPRPDRGPCVYSPSRGPLLTALSHVLHCFCVSPKSLLVGDLQKGRDLPRVLLSFHPATVLAHGSYLSVCGKNS